MGKASKWFRGLFGLKKSSSSSSSSAAAAGDSDRKPPPPSSWREKRRWRFVKSCKNENHDNYNIQQNDTSKPVVGDRSGYDAADDLSPARNDSSDEHAIAVATATAVAAEAAVAAAQAAAAVVRLTTNGARNRPAAHVSGGGAGVREEWAAIQIQSAFRGCLARRALRALRGLVKLQALVRGHIERKRTAEWLHRMHAMMQAQARAAVGRKELLLVNSAPFQCPGPATPEKFEPIIRSRSRKHEQSSLLRRNSSRSNGRTISPASDDHYGSQFDDKSGHLRSSAARNVDDERSDRILEIDPGKPKRRSLFHSNDQSPSSHEAQSSLKGEDVEEGSFCTANNSPQFYSASTRGGSRRSPFTPSKSDGSSSFLSGFSDYPNYMSYTESSKAKVRSVSAPRQRLHYERSGSAKRHSIQGLGESKQRISALQANFINKAYPGSGRLDKLGMPVGYRYY